MMAHRRCLRGLATAAAGSASAPVSMGVLTIIGRTFAEIREWDGSGGARSNAKRARLAPEGFGSG
ncbi:hypothetical protein NJB14197_46430 [Mycobacterium montefiorense]|uniref:Secreted protein n=1 Tax=Mycobacterium montefiorense TaxID=154654 RepID=A0AA37PL22_9MYCO|nr:hypothetical protein MmonteBS_46770 [Mycobacterium montefiorense]GKU35170.1 hypothetical protein NJB14191_25160 [Mycobacterium montefiorense]GKU40124.1 hypothetical protein NJB14192_21110 [Mycobacterium montefiorense]GKU46063.1 hypothetical protein NJB14194_26830 [Mycobacterium montefiorense]GKU52935.1 hypothetical protein NJB14195_41760 [Mycobacterium montefiorense]